MITSDALPMSEGLLELETERRCAAAVGRPGAVFVVTVGRHVTMAQQRFDIEHDIGQLPNEQLIGPMCVSWGWGGKRKDVFRLESAVRVVDKLHDLSAVSRRATEPKSPCTSRGGSLPAASSFARSLEKKLSLTANAMDSAEMVDLKSNEGPKISKSCSSVCCVVWCRAATSTWEAGSNLDW